MTFQTRRITLFSETLGEYKEFLQFKLSCKCCNKLFWSRRSTTKTCSNACRMFSSRQNHKLGKSKRK